MTNVEKFEICTIDGVLLQFMPEYVQLIWFYCNLYRFAAKSVIHAVLSQNLFCHNLRAFMWRKNDKY